MLASSLIQSVRYRVGDTSITKFTDIRIIELINEGLDDLARKISVNKGEITIPIGSYQREVKIPDDDFIKLLRVRCNNQQLKILSFDEIDKYENWESVVGTQLKAVIYNLSNPKILTLFPLLNEKAFVEQKALNKIQLGTIVDIPNTPPSSPLGAITEIEVDDSITIQTGDAGILSQIKDGFHSLYLRYVKRLPKVTSTLDEIALDEMFKAPLVYYLAGMLLLDDTRGENINKGLLFIEKYKTELQNLIDLTNSYYQDVKDFSTIYRTGFGLEYSEIEDVTDGK